MALSAVLSLSAVSPAVGATERRLHIVATTNIVGDTVRRVADGVDDVTVLMGPGVDPHLYNATQGDMRRLSRADVIFYNGLHLEGKMGDILVRMARVIPTYAVTEYMHDDDLLEPPAFAGLYDPHAWFDVALWRKAVERVRDALIEVNPGRADDYRRNADRYMAELQRLDEWVRAEIGSIPAHRRVLVTAHDAFHYFERAYGVEVIGLQGISTDTEIGLADVTRLVNIVVEREIPAIFVETSVPTRGVMAVIEGAAAKGHEVRLGGELFSDALGPEGTPEGTYVGMIRHNVRTIAEALRSP